jgi:hypothetical protein
MTVIPLMAGQSVWSYGGTSYEKKRRRARWIIVDVVMK